MSLHQPGAGSIITPGFTVSALLDMELLHSHNSADQNDQNVGVMYQQDL